MCASYNYLACDPFAKRSKSNSLDNNFPSNRIALGNAHQNSNGHYFGGEFWVDDFKDEMDILKGIKGNHGKAANIDDFDDFQSVENSLNEHSDKMRSQSDKDISNSSNRSSPFLDMQNDKIEIALRKEASRVVRSETSTNNVKTANAKMPSLTKMPGESLQMFRKRSKEAKRKVSESAHHFCWCIM